MPKTREMKKDPNALTLKEQRAVKAYIETGNQSEAIRRAGYETTNPDVNASIVFNKPRVREAVRRALVKHSIDESYILDKFKELTENSENDIVKVRSLENLASISDLYPDKHSQSPDDSQISITWQISKPKDKPAIEAEAQEVS